MFIQDINFGGYVTSAFGLGMHVGVFSCMCNLLGLVVVRLGGSTTWKKLAQA